MRTTFISVRRGGPACAPRGRHAGRPLRVFLGVAALIGIAWTQTSLLRGSAASARQAPEKKLGGYIVEHDGEVARAEDGPHNGGGQTVGYSFFRTTPKLSLVFRKRVMKPGSAIGYHEQKEDEIYYVLSGRGMMTLDGKTVEVTPGTAVLTRPGSSHGLKQVGGDDLVLLINYEQDVK